MSDSGQEAEIGRMRRVARWVWESIKKVLFVLLVIFIALIFGPLGWWLLEQAGVPIRKEGK